MPSKIEHKRKKSKDRSSVKIDQGAPVDAGKDWQSLFERKEKQNLALQGEIEKMKMEDKKSAQALSVRDAEIKDLLEKLALEKGWREKEEQWVQKLKSYDKVLHDQILRIESDLAKEHAHRLRLERELQDIRIKQDQQLEEKRQLLIKAGSLQTTLDVNVRDLRALRQENVLLKEKRADIQWVAKSEFEALKKLLIAKEQEFASVKAKVAG